MCDFVVGALCTLNVTGETLIQKENFPCILKVGIKETSSGMFLISGHDLHNSLLCIAGPQYSQDA